MYIFKYIDNQVYLNGSYVGTYNEWLAEHPDFPLVENDWLEYGENKFVRINSEGHDIPADSGDYQDLIDAINAL